MGKRRPFVGDRLLTVGEVAATMRVSNMTVYRLIKAGHLAAIRVGKNYRIRESDVNRYLSERAGRGEGGEWWPRDGAGSTAGGGPPGGPAPAGAAEVVPGGDQPALTRAAQVPLPQGAVESGEVRD